MKHSLITVDNKINVTSSSNFFSTLLELLGGGTGGVFFLGGLEGPPDGLGVLGGVGEGLVLGVNTNAAGILTVFSDFSNNFGEDAKAAVMTLGSMGWPFKATL